MWRKVDEGEEKEKLKMNVSDVITRLNHLGLDVQKKTKTGHYKVYDPKTGAWLFDVASTPSDPNWHYNIARNLRRMGLQLESKKFKDRSRQGNRKAAVDLDALHRAQEAARAAGEREPQLSDLDDAPPTSPLWNRSKQSGSRPLTSEAQREVIENMEARADTARVQYVRGRLQNFMMEKGDDLTAKAKARFPASRPGTGKIAEFARVAIYEVAPARSIRCWKNTSSAEQAVSKFLRDDTMGMSVWGLALVEATMDHVNGMKWGTYEIPDSARYPDAEEPESEKGEAAVTIQVGTPLEIAEELAVDEVQAEVLEEASKPEGIEVPVIKVAPPKPDDAKSHVAPIEAYRDGQITGYRERYIEVLLKMLENGKHSDEVVAMEIMPRLDKLLLGEDR